MESSASYSPTVECLVATGRAVRGPTDVVLPHPKEERVQPLSYPLPAPIFTRMHFPESLRGQEDPSQRAFPCCGQVLGLEGLEAEKLTRNVGPSFSVSPSQRQLPSGPPNRAPINS